MKGAKGFGAVALILGATGIGLAPILVRLSETGPVATGFYRIALAQPILWLILSRERKRGSAHLDAAHAHGGMWFAALAGFCFAGDLALWHWSIRLTTVANSTLLTNLAPFFVTLGGRVFFDERVNARLLIGMGVAFLGGFLLVAESLDLERRFLIGDALAVATALFYAGYLLCVKRLRETKSVWYVMAWTGVFTAPTLLAISLLSRETMLPSSAGGWAMVIALALVSHIGGQGLIAYGLAHISAAISSVLLMWQPVVAALLAWWILHESITKVRALGGLVIIAGIVLATWRRVGRDERDEAFVA
jgi:drug/metabolite transporter (DMT)-like permease